VVQARVLLVGGDIKELRKPREDHDVDGHELADVLLDHRVEHDHEVPVVKTPVGFLRTNHGWVSLMRLGYVANKRIWDVRICCGEYFMKNMAWCKKKKRKPYR